ncbi:hypothetical protein R3W88_004328 [Solanum pinnatisectum]|uniref:Ninja-family protein n=1 Tax=Solanum pinnatisectum TaxID=50273 RepID=A0AAV9KAX4_9SOLN|nr:hypothetical protein R3W88_004328 [Solanum pinnatisectum]
MEKDEENTGTSNVENENVELNGNFDVHSKKMNSGSQGSVASSVAEVETQQPPTQGIKILRIDLYSKNHLCIQGIILLKGRSKNFMLNHMTFVFTRGEGPYGKKTEGLLYLCKKKDEVEIICLCHGDLLNAVEFVEHIGGGYVEHPLNHIFIDGKQIKQHCY